MTTPPHLDLCLRPTHTGVFSVHQADGLHVGNLKRIGAIWKFKAVGYDDTGGVEPGGGPFTLQHNTVLVAPNATELNAALSALRMRPGLN